MAIKSAYPHDTQEEIRAWEAVEQQVNIRVRLKNCEFDRDTYEILILNVKEHHVDWMAVEQLLNDADVPPSETPLLIESFAKTVRTKMLCLLLAERMEQIE